MEVNFTNTYKTLNNKKSVEAPHWPSDKYKFKYSSKPAVFQINKAINADIKVKVDSKGVSGQGVLKGIIGSCEFEGKAPLSSGEHTVTVSLNKPIDDIQWLKGPIVWVVEGDDMSAAAGSTFIEVFSVFEDPTKLPFFSEGVWADALRFLFENANIRGTEKSDEAVKEVTKCCFGLDYHKYEIKNGRPMFGGASGKFKLEKYIKPIHAFVNCYDQMYAVVVFSGALGIEVMGLFMNPFGFLNATNLVGWGNSNNPFPEKKCNSEIKRLSGSLVGKAKLKLNPLKPEDFLIVNKNDPDRQSFGNHMFCEFTNKVFDSCAGPVVGNGDRNKYVDDNIDAITDLNKLYGGLPGRAYNISDYHKVGANVLEVL